MVTRRGVVVVAALALIACDDKDKSAPVDAAPPVVSIAPIASSVPPAASSAPAATAETAAPTSIAAQHVLVAYKGAKGAPKDVTRSKADAKKRADEVVAKAKGGTDFSELAAQYSDDDSKTRQGNLGKFTRDKMVKPFADAAFALKVGEISEPVETVFGFHVIKRNQ